MDASASREGAPGPGELVIDLILSLDGCAADAVRRMKREATMPLLLTGSLSLGHSLMREGLVDRFRLVLFPVITGRTGLERIWDRFEDYSLELLTARTFEGGLQLLEYAPTHLEQPPGTDWDREAAAAS